VHNIGCSGVGKEINFMETVSCQPCCATAIPVNVPGPEGPEATDGATGVNATTFTTADFVIPAAGANVTVAVEDSSWMVVGQILVFGGPANFQVVSIPNTTSVELMNLGYTGDVVAGSTIVSGTQVSPSGVQATLQAPLTVYAAGTVYSLTATPALLDFGTTDPQLTLTSAGTYMLFARVKYDYTGATFAARRTVTTKLRRTNNTPADLADGSDAFSTEIITTQTYIAGIRQISALYAATAGDVIEIWGDVSVVPSAGSIDASAAQIIAVRLF
jgi:hypothetical protein